MVTVQDLVPGDLVSAFERSAVFVAQTDHPLYLHPIRLVVWKLDDGTWSHDALDYRQEVGERVPSTVDERMARLRGALHG